MANDLIQSIRKSLALITTGVDDDTRAVAGSSGSKRISIKGGVFRKLANGEEVGKIEDRHMNVIFVKLAHTPARTYYTQGYEEGAKVAPVCWSSDSKTPDEAVKDKPATSCDKCPHSVKGTGQNGKGTACRLQWRTAVVLPDSVGGDVLQLVLPATSVFGKEENGKWPFRAYIQMLANNNISASRVVTRMQFDTAQSVPTLLFSPVDAVTAEELEVISEQGKSAAAESAVKLEIFQKAKEEAPVEVAQPAPVEAVAEKKTRKPREEKKQEPETAAEEPRVEEPKLRETEKNKEAHTPPSVSDVIAKWSKKK
jgi:hypothetical protein